MQRQQSSLSYRSTASANSLARTESYQYPYTHYGHLTPPQTKALESFKTLCAAKNYYKPGTATTRATHDDETLLRYLRARKFRPEDAFKQFKDTGDWRRVNQIDRLYDTIDIHEYDETRKLYPQWTGRRDKRGIPVYVFEVAGLTSKKMAEYDKSLGQSQTESKIPPKMQRLFALYENLLRFTMPLCSSIPTRPYPETPVSQSNNIVDISKVGIKQFWNLKAHMQDASQLATAHYPETLDRIFIIGAPSFFPTVWGWIKRWFDPITVSKIFILSHTNMKSTLEQYMEPSDIPKKYGGTLDWEWGQLPSLDPQIMEALEWHNPSKDSHGRNGFPVGPVKWKEDDNGRLVAHAVGSIGGKKRDDVVATLIASQADPLDSVSPAVDVREAFGEPSTTGEHTHPHDDDEYFPTSGNTPTDEQDEPLMEGTGAPLALTLSQANAGTAPAGQQPTRTGTSEVKFEQQEHTSAAGALAEGTPAVVDHGHGDKTVTMEPRTVGQAPKDVDLPERQTDDAPEQPSYVDQAKAMATSAYETASSTVVAAEHKAMEAMGYATEKSQEPEPKPDSSHETGSEKKPDRRIDGMEKKQVEDFIRDQYATSNKEK